MSKICPIFKACVKAIQDGVLIEREDRKDKEFHFQNWFKNRLEALDLKFDSPGRNSYPDFVLVHDPEGFELKGLAYPGRDADYDCNSQVPRGEHNGRQVYYTFGRYPTEPDGDSYPVLDLVMCHGSFLNADNTYVHKNKVSKVLEVMATFLSATGRCMSRRHLSRLPMGQHIAGHSSYLRSIRLIVISWRLVVWYGVKLRRLL